MVHPLMRSTPTAAAHPETAREAPQDAEKIAARIIEMLPRLHVLVVGPGLGRDPLMQDTVAHVVRAAREQNMPVVMDADALALVQRDPALVRGYGLAVLTPNVVEFGRLAKALDIEKEAAEQADKQGETAKVQALARALGGVTIVQKGGKDFISNGKSTLAVDLQGGLKRSGGQGDTLTGSIATFLGWRKAYMDGIWETGGKLKEEELVQLAAFGGSAITRVSSASSFLRPRAGSAQLTICDCAGMLAPGVCPKRPQSPSQRPDGRGPYGVYEPVWGDGWGCRCYKALKPWWICREESTLMTKTMILTSQWIDKIRRVYGEVSMSVEGVQCSSPCTWFPGNPINRGKQYADIGPTVSFITIPRFVVFLPYAGCPIALRQHCIRFTSGRQAQLTCS